MSYISKIAIIYSLSSIIGQLDCPLKYPRRFPCLGYFCPFFILQVKMRVRFVVLRGAHTRLGDMCSIKSVAERVGDAEHESGQTSFNEQHSPHYTLSACSQAFYHRKVSLCK